MYHLQRENIKKLNFKQNNTAGYNITNYEINNETLIPSKQITFTGIHQVYGEDNKKGGVLNTVTVCDSAVQ